MKLTISLSRCFSSFLWSFFDYSYFAELLSETYLEPSREIYDGVFSRKWWTLTVFVNIIHHRCSTGFKIRFCLLMVTVYMALLVSMYICLFQNVPRVFFFQIQNCIFFFDSNYFYEMVICCIIVITSHNNAVFYKLNTLIKSKLKLNWSKKLKPLADAALHIENTTDKLRLDFFQPYLFYFCDLDLF